MLKRLALILLCFSFGLSNATYSQSVSSYFIVLGVAQDAGYPQMGCTKQCCTQAWNKPAMRRNVVSLALVDPTQKKWWLFEATPDIKQQLQNFKNQTKNQYPYLPEGIFLTHAHIGHYTGLMEFGREVMNTAGLKVYVLPKMKAFLTQNGPWSQLVKLKNIDLIDLKADQPVTLGENKVTAFTVPHRDEYSETAGFNIVTAHKKYLFIPDINKWSKWDKNIINEVKQVDVALLDATFYTNTEMGNRPIAEVPHPLVSETIDLFKNESVGVKKKIYFIHFNHTNPLLWDKATGKKLNEADFNFALENQIL